MYQVQAKRKLIFYCAILLLLTGISCNGMANETTLASVFPNGMPAGAAVGGGGGSDISADGRYVVFDSDASVTSSTNITL